MPGQERFGVEDVLSLIVSEARARGGGTMRRLPVKGHMTVLAAAWRALNSWIEEQYRRSKGADIPFFGKFSWEVLDEDDTAAKAAATPEGAPAKHRPIFVPAEGFCRSHNIRFRRPFTYRKTVHNEEINFSKLAIRYSNNLTKDMAFYAVREIMKHLGALIGRGLDMEIAFGVGTLHASERRMRFEFDNFKIMKLFRSDWTPLDAAPVVPTYKRPSLPPPEPAAAESGASSPRNSTSPAAAPAVPEADTDTAAPDAPDMDAGPPAVPDLALADAESDHNSVADSAALTSVVDGLPFGRHAASEAVVEQAYQRYFDRIADEAFEEANQNRQISEYEDRVDAQYRERRDRSNRFRTEVAGTVHTQMQDVAARRAEEVEERKEDLATTAFPPEGHIDSLEGEILRIKQNSETMQRLALIPGNKNGPTRKVPEFVSNDVLLRDLQAQIRAKEHAREAHRNRTLEEEKRFVEHVSMELDMMAATKRAESLERQRQLLGAWERDGHIRNLQKLKTVGPGAVQTYMGRSGLLREAGQRGASPDWASSSSIGGGGGSHTVGIAGSSGSGRPMSGPIPPRPEQDLDSTDVLQAPELASTMPALPLRAPTPPETGRSGFAAGSAVGYDARGGAR